MKFQHVDPSGKVFRKRTDSNGHERTNKCSFHIDREHLSFSRFIYFIQ